MISHTPAAITITLLRAPTHLYDWHAGWILGRRFLRLTHVGRRSGRHYETMLEVIGENRASGEVIVIAGLGHAANWYRNLQTHPAIEVAIGRERFTPRHRQLSQSEAATVLASYEQRNRLIAPIIHRVLSWLIGWNYDGTEIARRQLLTQLPVIALRPAEHPLASAPRPSRTPLRDSLRSALPGRP